MSEEWSGYNARKLKAGLGTRSARSCCALKKRIRIFNLMCTERESQYSSTVVVVVVVVVAAVAEVGTITSQHNRD